MFPYPQDKPELPNLRGIYRSRCVATRCNAIWTTFQPITTCDKCGMPVTQIEFRPEGTEGEDETIEEMANEVLAGFENLLNAQ